MNDLSAKHLLEKEYFRFSDLESLDAGGYFDCLDILKSLLRDPDFKKSTPGFYINYVTNMVEDDDDGKNSVRLTYFTIDTYKTLKLIGNFEKTNRDKIRIYHSKTTERPNKNNVSLCTEEELRFRKFLNSYTQIGLDLLENFGRLCTRRLVATYRFDCHPHTPEWVIRPKPFFEPVFNKHSEFFRELNDGYFTEQLWEDLERSERGPRGIWLHYFVNMLLPGDWNEYGYVIPEELKKRMLESKRLDVPEDWKLDCEI